MRSDPEGVARVGVGILDTGFDRSQLREPSWPYGSLPVAGLARQGIERVAAAWADADLPPELLVPGPDALTRLLLASARPVDGHAREVGAGEVSPGTTAIFLSRLDAGEYLRHLLGPRPGAQRVAATAGDIALTDDLLPGMLTVWRTSAFAWLYDFRRPGPLWSLSFLQSTRGGPN
jgi:hypothetical protein